jgi:hypothetical protein
MKPCAIQEAGSIELFFYDELPEADRAQVAEHVRHCRDCAQALDDLRTIREVLASRPDVSAPPAGDWSGFMRRLDAVIAPPRTVVVTTRRYAGLVAMAALLALVASSVFFVAKQASRLQPVAGMAGLQSAAGTAGAVATTGIRSAGEKHFERSKLVVLGLANRDEGVTSEDWAYERELAAALLDDTRLYRMAAEQHGMTTLAGIMRDLELVLLETSMADGADHAELGQIQRLIQKRNLIEKMDTVASAGM